MENFSLIGQRVRLENVQQNQFFRQKLDFGNRFSSRIYSQFLPDLSRLEDLTLLYIIITKTIWDVKV